jgi:cytochrome c-type biogenesis protein CcmE
VDVTPRRVLDVSPRTFPDGKVLEGAGVPPGSPGHAGGTGGEPPRKPRRRRNVRAYALALVVLVALGFVLFRGLGNATLFFYNVDEAVARQHSLGQKRFRLQGTVEAASIVRTEDGASFTVTYNGAEASVVHRGDLPQLFQPSIPVVLEGHWQDGTFESDRMLVKHSEVYEAKNPDRVKDYEGAPGATPTSGGTPIGGTPAGAATP